MADRWSKLGTLWLVAIGLLLLVGAAALAYLTVEDCAYTNYALQCAIGRAFTPIAVAIAALHLLAAVGLWKRWGGVVLIGIVVTALGFLFGVAITGERGVLIPGLVIAAGYAVSLTALARVARDRYA